MNLERRWPPSPWADMHDYVIVTNYFSKFFERERLREKSSAKLRKSSPDTEFLRNFAPTTDLSTRQRIANFLHKNGTLNTQFQANNFLAV